MTTRSDFIGRSLGAAALAGIAGSACSAATGSLASSARQHGRFYGAAVKADRLFNDVDFQRAVLRECSHLTPEVELKWASIEPDYGQLDFGQLDALMSFATRHDKRVRGHTLLWDKSVPAWASTTLRSTPDWTLIRRYFASVIPRYGDVIEQWDVVNEPIDTGHRMDGLRETIFLEAFGTEYIARALHEARSFAPRGQLMINEYGLEYDSIEERDRRYLLLKLLDRLKESGAPIDGLGLQAHLDLKKGPCSQTAIASFLKEVKSLGLFVVVTELDVTESDYVAPVAKRDRLVGDEVRRYLETVFAEATVPGVATWGLSDRYSWLEVTKLDLARFPGAWADGTGPGLNRGLPLDASLRQKPMYDAIEAAMDRA
jgi:endo-1,4-beta-xylanase